MTGFKKIKQDLQPAKLQCSAAFTNKSQYNAYYLQRRQERCAKNGMDLDKCTNYAAYNINGHGFCRQHAGSIALDIMLKLDGDLKK